MAFFGIALFAFFISLDKQQRAKRLGTMPERLALCLLLLSLRAYCVKQYAHKEVEQHP